MQSRRGRVAVVGGCALDSLATSFDLVTVEEVGAVADLLPQWEGAARERRTAPEGEDETENDRLDCVVCPADAVATVREYDASVPVVAVVDEDSGGRAVFARGATDVLPENAPTAVARRRVENAVASGRLPTVEAALESERALLSDLFERVPIHLYVKDESGRHVRVSHAYLEDPEAFIGERDIDLADSPHTTSSYADDRYVIETGEPVIDKEEDLTDVERAGWSMEHYLTQYASIDPPDVTEEWVLTSKVPRYDSDGNVVGLIGVTRDISERKRYRRRLEAQNERLDEFAAIVSHDLRNPLNVAEGYLELAREECASPHLDQLEVSLDRMSAIVDDVLTLARQGQTVERTTAVDLAAAVRKAWTTTDGGDARLDVGTLPRVEADSVRLRRLLENLLGNAVEHGGADVTVRVEWLDDEGGFAVDDDGRGIDADERDQVFDRGYTTSKSGAGFGLAIVEQLAAAHGWTVSVTAGDCDGARVEVRGVETVDG